MSICPKTCIKMQRDNEGFLYPVVDKVNCINCGLCEKICPVINSVDVKQFPKVYAAYNKNLKVRLSSFSGGIFYALARKIVKEGGAVFGAAFNELFEVRHTYIENEGDIKELMGSKYVQSEIGNSYITAKKILQEGRKVLFSGTPCQIAGLYAYLNMDYENLITVDIICHGVPSPKVWKEYVNLQKRRGEIRKVNFRDKKYGWSNFSISFQFDSGETYTRTAGRDRYMRGFLTNVFLRPSCYECVFKGEQRIADITLADFWGLENVRSDIEHDNQGISMILVNSIKAEEYLKADLGHEIQYYIINDASAAIKQNSAAIVSVVKNKNREAFFADFHKNGIAHALKKYCSYRRISGVYLNLKIFVYKCLKKSGFI